MSFFSEYFEDKEKGGLFHVVSEDFSKVLNPEKHVDDQFTAARTNVIGAMISHDPETIKDAEKALNEVIERFEDKKHGGYFLKADKDWKIVDRNKSLSEAEAIFGLLMHIYEVTKKDEYLLKALDYLDLTLEYAWDQKQGGFFSLYCEDWSKAADTKDLTTQAGMLQHLGGAWKDGIDSPYAVRAEAFKRRARAFADLILEKAADKVNGGFYTSFTGDWKPLEKEKEISQLASLALTLYFHYHNVGPSVWGPRKGSHAYTGRPYPAVYAYRGPAPSTDPVSPKAYTYGKTVVEIADILVAKAWDAQYGGFYTKLTEKLAPADNRKMLSTQVAALMALNVAYRLTGYQRFRDKLTAAVRVMEDKCFDQNNGGVYTEFARDWLPLSRDKVCGPNLLMSGIMSMFAPVIDGVPVMRNTLRIWADPPAQTIKGGKSAHLTVTVQNQGFEPMKVRVGGLSAPTRWMEPPEMVVDLTPHQVSSYKLTITPPKGVPSGPYYFELTLAPAGEVGEYVAVGGKVVVE